jgi:three-Cys-motif partner protein
MQDKPFLKITSRYKHHILEQYFSEWLKRYGKYHRLLIYIDFFAGPGKYENHFPGSPLIVLRAARKVLKENKTKLCMILIEKQKRIYKQLNDEILRFSIPQENIQIHNICANSLQAGESLIRLFQDNTPTFIFVDPYRYPLGQPLLNRFLTRKHNEILLNFMFFRINMGLYNPKVITKGNQLFGCRNWGRYLFTKQNKFPLRPNIVGFYENRIHARYKAHFRVPFSPEDKVPNPKNMTKYYLILFTNSRKSNQTMRIIMNKYGRGLNECLVPLKFNGRK